MKKLEHLDKYVIMPMVEFYGGYVYDGEDIELDDTTVEDDDGKIMIMQTIEQGVLYTDIKTTYKRPGNLKVLERSHMETELKEGELLVYVPGTGFTIPSNKMCTIDEVIGRYQLLKGEDYDIAADEDKGIAADRGDQPDRKQIDR